MLWLGYKDGDVSSLLLNGDHDATKIQTQLINFFTYLRNNGNNLSPRTLKQYHTALKSFYEYNDINNINWRKVRKTIGHLAKKAIDRPYNYEEIRRLLNYADERKRVIILLMASSGMCSGAISGLKLRDLQYIDEHSLYQITVYRNEPEEYITFCNFECASAIQSYLDFRKRHGEILTDNSPLIRDHFNARGATAQQARSVDTETIQNEIYFLLYQAGIRDHSNMKTKHGDRYQIMVTHALRKHFKTKCMSAELNPVIVEMLMGHSVGLEKVYYKPQPQDLLKEYIKAIPALTINEESRLKQKVDVLTVRDKEREDRLIKLQEQFELINKRLGLSK
jgi:integrase